MIMVMIADGDDCRCDYDKEEKEVVGMDLGFCVASSNHP